MENPIFDEKERIEEEEKIEASNLNCHAVHSLSHCRILDEKASFSKRNLRNLLEQSRFSCKKIVDNNSECKTECFKPCYERPQMGKFNNHDHRTKVKNPHISWPHSAIGIVQIIEENTDKSLGQSTGTMIGPNFVLTAAHALRSDDGVMLPASKIRFIPAANGANNNPFGIIRVVAYDYDLHYITNQAEAEDYALLVLEHEIHEKTGYLGLHACSEKTLKEMIPKVKFQLWGYSVEKDNEQWGMKEKLDSVGKYVILYKSIDTAEGQSGASVYYGDKDDFWIIGIHKGGRESNNGNVGIRLSMQKIKKILNWMEKYISLSLNDMNLSEAEWKALSNLEDIKIMGFAANNGQKFSELPELLNRSSVLTTLILKGICKEMVAAMAQNQTWSSLHTLTLSENKIGDDTAALAHNNVWANLHTLELSMNQIGDQGASILSQNTSWKNLKTLHLWSNKIGSLGAKDLARNTVWTNLYFLHLGNNQIGDEGAAALGHLSEWPNLHEINLSSNQIGDEGATELAKNIAWKKLHILVLLRNDIGDSGVEALAKNSTWKELQILNLRMNQIGDKGATELAKNMTWGNLQDILLPCNYINNEGATGLAQNKGWRNLMNIELSGNSIGDEGIAALAQNTTWSRLKKLDLSENVIGDEGTVALSQNIAWKDLQNLVLSSNQIGDKGAIALSENKFWPKLQRLELSENNITYQGSEALALAQKRIWTELTELILDGNYLGEKGVMTLIENEKFQTLGLANNQIGNEGLKRMIERNPWPNLKSLNLNKNDLTWEGFPKLAEFKPWNSLTHLSLANNYIGPQGAGFLAVTDHWQFLKSLDLSYNKIQDQGAEYLSIHSTFPSLQKLNLKNNQISGTGALYLSQNTSWTELKFLGLSWNDILMRGAIAIMSNTQVWKKLQNLYLVQTGICPTEEVKFKSEIQTKFVQELKETYNQLLLPSKLTQVLSSYHILSSHDQPESDCFISGYDGEFNAYIFDSSQPLKITIR